MAAYLVGDSGLTDPDRYGSYKVRAKPLVEKYGGEYLARGGKLSIKEDTLWTPTRMVLIRSLTPAAPDAAQSAPALV